MSTPRQDFEIAAGTAKQVFFNLTDENGPLDLTNATLTWRTGPSPSGAAILQKTSQLGIVVVGDPVDGVIMLQINDGDIPDSGLYWHDLEVKIAGATSAAASGRIVVQPSVTAPA